MKSLYDYMITEAKLDMVDADINTMLTDMPENTKQADLAEAINDVLKMGYKPVSNSLYGDKYKTWGFYLFSKGKASDMVLISCCARERWGKEPRVLVYTSSRSSISLASDGEIIVRASDGHQKTKNTELNMQEMVDIRLQEGDFGELNNIFKKTTWYTKAKFWMRSNLNSKINIWNVVSFYK